LLEGKGPRPREAGKNRQLNIRETPETKGCARAAPNGQAGHAIVGNAGPEPAIGAKAGGEGFGNFLRAKAV